MISNAGISYGSGSDRLCADLDLDLRCRLNLGLAYSILLQLVKLAVSVEPAEGELPWKKSTVP